MAELNNVVARVATSPTPTATAFTLEGIDSTSFVDWVASPGVRAVTTWTTIAQVTSVDFGAGAVESIDITTLLDTARQNATGLISRPDITVNVFADYATGAAQTAMDVAANAGTILPFRAVRSSGYRRLWAGTPSEVGESVAVNQAITGSFTITVRSNRYVRYLT
jgi:hypothetical protein